MFLVDTKQKYPQFHSVRDNYNAFYISYDEDTLNLSEEGKKLGPTEIELVGIDLW